MSRRPSGSSPVVGSSRKPTTGSPPKDEGKVEPVTLTAREPPGGRATPRLEAHLGEQLPDRAAGAVEARTERRHLPHPKRPLGGSELEDHADAAAIVPLLEEAIFAPDVHSRRGSRGVRLTKADRGLAPTMEVSYHGLEMRREEGGRCRCRVRIDL